jgi:hypothetical protein
MPENGNSKPTKLRLTQLSDCFCFLGIGALLWKADRATPIQPQ